MTGTCATPGDASPRRRRSPRHTRPHPGPTLLGPTTGRGPPTRGDPLEALDHLLRPEWWTSRSQERLGASHCAMSGPVQVFVDTSSNKASMFSGEVIE